MGRRLRLPDAHPNATMSRLWAECIENALRPRFAAPNYSARATRRRRGYLLD
jgi:hypothetical protein